MLESLWLSILRIRGPCIVVRHLGLGGLCQAALAQAVVAVLILLRILQGLGILVLGDEILQWMLILQGLKALLHIVLTYILVERLKRLLLWLRLIDELAQRIRQTRRAPPILTSSSVGVQAQVIQLLCKLLILKIWLQTMACPSWPRDA